MNPAIKTLPPWKLQAAWILVWVTLPFMALPLILIKAHRRNRILRAAQNGTLRITRHV